MKFADIDIETHVHGSRPDPRTDTLVFVGIRLANGDKAMFHHPTHSAQIQSIITDMSAFVGHNIKSYDIPIMERHGYNFNRRDGFPKVVVDTYDIAQKRLKVMLYLDLSPGEFSLGSLCERFNLPIKKGSIDYDIFKKTSWTDDEIAEMRDYLFADLDSSWELFKYFFELFSGLSAFMGDKDRKKLKWLTASAGSAAYKIVCNMSGREEVYAGDDITVESDETYEGGFVALPYRNSVEGDIYCCDFRSEYPHMFMGGNLYSKVPAGTPGAWHGNDLFPPIENVSSGDGIRGWYSRTQGTVESTIYNLLTRRMGVQKRLKELAVIEKGSLSHAEKEEIANCERESLAIKIVINTIYGITGSKVFTSVYDLDTAADCTAMARMCTKHGRAVLTSRGYECLYTDSVAEESMVAFKIGSRVYYGTFAEMWETCRPVGEVQKMDGNREYLWLDGVVVETKTVNADRTVSWGRAEYIMRHLVDETCYEIASKSTKLITTKDHGIMQYNRRKGVMSAVTPLELERIVVPHVDVSTMPNDGAPDVFAETIGYWLSRGYRIVPKTGVIRFHISTNEHVLSDILGSMPQMVGAKITRNERCVEVQSRWLASKLASVNFKSARSYIVESSFATRKALARAYFGSRMLQKDDGFFITKASRDGEHLFAVHLAASIGVVVNSFVYNKATDKNPTVMGMMFPISSITKFGEVCGAVESHRLTHKTPKIKKSFTASSTLVNVSPVHYKGFVYDIEVTNTHTFIANGVPVHNTDSIFFVDSHHDEQRVKDTLSEISETQRRAFNVYIDTHELQLESKIDKIWFFTDAKGVFVKKFYIYLKHKSDEPVVKGLSIVKGDCSPLAKMVWEKHIKPLAIAKKELMFEPEYLLSLVRSEFSLDVDILTKRFRVKEGGEYKTAGGKDEPTSIQYRIAKKYGSGEHYLIPNTLIGVGSQTMYATCDELRAAAGDDWITHVDVKGVMSNLGHFIEWSKRGVIKRKKFYL